MKPFDTETLTHLATIAEGCVKSNLPKISAFLGMEGDRAVFGIRFDAPGKLGLPVFMMVTRNGECEEIKDRDERFRLMDLWEAKS